MSDIWDPERIRIVGSVLERYSAHLAPGHRIRCGMEGDECSIYRSTSDSPTATVLEVTREPNGYVKFRAQMDSSGAVVDFDNRNIAPGSIWEIDPEYLETFRGHVERSLDGPTMDRTEDVEEPEEPEDLEAMFAEGGESSHDRKAENEDKQQETVDPFEDYRSSILSTMDERFREQELKLRAEFGAKSSMDDEFKETMAETVRMLTEDMRRLSRGDQPQFSERYADKYDDAMQEKDDDIGGANDMENEEDTHRGVETRQPSTQKHKKRYTHQDEKTDFTMDFVNPVTYKEDFRESKELTDEEDAADNNN